MEIGEEDWRCVDGAAEIVLLASQCGDVVTAQMKSHAVLQRLVAPLHEVRLGTALKVSARRRTDEREEQQVLRTMHGVHLEVVRTMHGVHLEVVRTMHGVHLEVVHPF